MRLPFKKHLLECLCPPNPHRQGILNLLGRIEGAKIDDLCEDPDGARGQLVAVQLGVPLLGRPSAVRPALLAKRHPNVLSEPRPPSGALEAARLDLDLPRAQDPEDALEVLLPVLAGTAQHLVRRDDERCRHQLAAVLVCRVTHGLLHVVQGLVVVLERGVLVRALIGADASVERLVEA